MSATVTNNSKQPVTLILDHPAFHTKQSGWQRTTASFASYNEDGARNVSEVRRIYPASLTLFPGQSSPDLHAAVVKCSQMPALLARRILTVKFSDADGQATDGEETQVL